MSGVIRRHVTSQHPLGAVRSYWKGPPLFPALSSVLLPRSKHLRKSEFGQVGRPEVPINDV